MRSEFVEAETIEDAEAVCAWAAKVIEVEGGFHAFESIADYEMWRKQSEVEFGSNEADHYRPFDFRD